MAMMDDPEMYVLYSEHGRKKAIATIFPTYGWLALGTYFNKTGGMDTFPNNEYTRNALATVWEKYPEYNIIMEGVIASTIKSTYAKLFKEYNEKFEPRKVLVVNLLPPIETCLARIQARNGGIKINEKLVVDKWNIVDRNVQYFKDEGFKSIRLDNSNIPMEKVLPKFFKFCSKYEV